MTSVYPAIRCAHLRDERVCFYLAKAVKVDAEPNFKGAGLGELPGEVSDAILAIQDRQYPIRKALERADRSGSRMRRRIPGLAASALGAAPEMVGRKVSRA